MSLHNLIELKTFNILPEHFLGISGLYMLILVVLISYNVFSLINQAKTIIDVNKPVTDEPVTDEPVAEKPVTDEPVAEEPVTDEPVTEEPVTDEPVTEKPVTDEPVAEKSNSYKKKLELFARYNLIFWTALVIQILIIIIRGYLEDIWKP